MIIFIDVDGEQPVCEGGQMNLLPLCLVLQYYILVNNNK